MIAAGDRLQQRVVAGGLHLPARGPAGAPDPGHLHAKCPTYWSRYTMAIEVRIPTILRTYTSGQKSIEGTGATLDELFADLDGRYGGLRERLVDSAGLRRFVNVYLNDEDVRFLGGLAAPVTDGDTVTVLPAVAGGSR
jgi:sulfur-carrier protein